MSEYRGAVVNRSLSDDNSDMSIASLTIFWNGSTSARFSGVMKNNGHTSSEVITLHFFKQ